jgi:type IV secretory pathway component VirB8
MSVGLQQVAEPDTAAQKEMVKKYMELREKIKREQESQNPPTEL